MSHRALIRTLALSAALLLALPAGGRAASGGAAAPTLDGGAGVGTAAPAPPHRPAAAGHRRGRHRGVGGASARRRAQVPRPAPTAAATPVPATLLADGTVLAPAGAPPAVIAAVAAGNRIASLPYRWGGGHASWEDSGYDCSGSVGYALHGAGLLEASVTSGDLMSYGEPGPGAWITIYANRDHVYMTIAGLRFDTSGAAPSRWQAAPRSSAGFRVRHPAGL